jgi:hypothetical protein
MMFGQFDSKFTGKLEVVNTGCFSDGECFVVVDGKHVTAIMGWSREVVGKIEGLKNGEGFGDLEKYIGKEVEVFAKELEYGNYTLYGDAEYYIKVK